MTYQEKRKLLFYSILGSLLFVILLVTTISLIPKLNSNIKTTLIVIILIIFALVLLTLKSKFDYYDFVTKYHLLIENGNEPKKSKVQITSPEWMKKLAANKFVIYRDYTDFKLYYRFDQVTSKNKRSKTAVIVIEINSDLNFEDQAIVSAINSFETDFVKKEKFKNHIILQFKNTDNFNQDNIHSTQNISFTKPVKNHYVIVINCLYSLAEQKVFYVNSETHSPNHYYTYAANIVESLI